MANATFSMYFNSEDSTTNCKPNAIMVSHVHRLLSATIELRLECFGTHVMFLGIVLLDQCSLG